MPELQPIATPKPPADVQQYLRPLFKKLRKRRGMSQIEICNVLAVSYSTVCRFEQGLNVGSDVQAIIQAWCDKQALGI